MTDTTATPLPPGLLVLRALRAARAAMPTLVAALTGEGADGRDFHYPSDDDLRTHATKALDDAGLMLLPDEEAMQVTGAEATLRWQLVHIDTGDTRPFKLQWGRFDDGPRSSAAAAWATASTWSHATRHMLCKLLNVRVILPADYERRKIAGQAAGVAAPGSPAQPPITGSESDYYDGLVGRLPAHMQPPAPAPPPAAPPPPADLGGLLNVLEDAHNLLGDDPSLDDAGRTELAEQREAIPVLLEPAIKRLRHYEQTRRLTQLRLRERLSAAAAAVQPPAPGRVPPAIVEEFRTAAVPPAPDPFDRLQIAEPLRRWKDREHASRRAVNPEARAPTMADAWAAATGGPPRAPVTADEFKRLLGYLVNDDARNGGAT